MILLNSGDVISFFDVCCCFCYYYNNCSRRRKSSVGSSDVNTQHIGEE